MAYINKEVSTMAMPSGMNRMGQFPLDMSSVYYDLDSLKAYAQSGAIAYVGQIVSLVDEANSKVTVYSIQNLAGDLKEVGTIPLGDNKSIEVDANATISMHDFGKAYYKYIPADEEAGTEAYYERVEVSETNLWKAGLEPKVVTEDGQLVIGWFEPNPTTIEGVNDQVTAVQGTVADLESSVGAPSAEGQEATGLYKEVEDVQADVEVLVDSVGNEDDSLSEDVNTLWANVNDHSDRIEALEGKEDKDTTYSVADGEKVLSLNGTAFGTTLKIDYSDNKIRLLGINDEEISSFDASAFVEDGVLQDVEYEAATRELVFTWNIITGTDTEGNPTYKTDRVSIADLVDTYTAGNGLALDSNAFSVKLADGSESFLSVDANGLKLSGVADAIDAAKQAAIDDAAGKYATTGALTQLETDLDARLDTLEAIDHTVYATKEALKATDDKAVSNATAITNLTGRIDDIVAEGGEPNQINNIKVNGVVQVIAEDKSVDLAIPTKFSDLTDDSGFGALITAAQDQADKGVADAATAKSAADGAQAKADEAFEDAAAAQSTADSALAKAGANETAITALQNADTTLGGKITALETTVNNEISGVAANYAAITNINSTLGTLTAKDTAHDEKLAALETSTGNNATAITGLQSAVGNVYTKTESDGKYATIANVGTPTEGKTIVQMIAEAQTAATYDDTQVKADIASNASAIAAIYTAAEGEAAASGVLVTEIARVEGLISAEETRATTAEQALAKDIAEINTLLNTVDSEDSITSLKELATWVEEHGSEAAEMAESISANTEAIDALDERLTTAEGKLTPEAEKNTIVSVSLGSEAALTPDANRNVAIPVALATALGVVKSSPAATYNEETGVWSGENKITVAEDGVMEVNALNVNKIVQNDGDYLILYGGTATE